MSPLPPTAGAPTGASPSPTSRQLFLLAAHAGSVAHGRGGSSCPGRLAVPSHGDMLATAHPGVQNEGGLHPWGCLPLLKAPPLTRH